MPTLSDQNPRVKRLRKPLSEEAKRNIAEANKRRVWTPEMREKAAAAQRGKTASEETRRRLSTSHQGRKRTDAERAAISAGRKAAWERLSPDERDAAKRQFLAYHISTRLTPELLARISRKGKTMPEDARKRIAEAHRGRPKPATQRFKIGVANSQRIHTPQMRRNMSQAQAKAWAALDPNTREERIARFVADGTKLRGNTTIELAVADVLSRLNVPFEQHVSMERWRPDFFLLQLNLVIECDGDYWHDPVKRPERAERDRRKDAFFASRGINVVHLWEHEIRADAEGAVKLALALATLDTETLSHMARSE